MSTSGGTLVIASPCCSSCSVSLSGTEWKKLLSFVAVVVAFLGCLDVLVE
jgi:hypothetical protein